MRLVSRPREKMSTAPMNPKNSGPRLLVLKECTEEITPLRVRNVPKSVRANVMITRKTFQTLSMFFFS